MPGFLGRKRPPEPPVEPVDREELFERLGGALEHKVKVDPDDKVDPIEEQILKRSAARTAGQAWRRALRGDDPVV